LEGDAIGHELADAVSLVKHGEQAWPPAHVLRLEFWQLLPEHDE
jgi:hypothetical protein